MIDNWRCPNCGSLNPPRRSKCRSCGSINIQFESEGSGPKDDALDVQPTVEATRGSRAEVEANNVLSPKEENKHGEWCGQQQQSRVNIGNRGKPTSYLRFRRCSTKAGAQSARLVPQASSLRKHQTLPASSYWGHNAM